MPKPNLLVILSDQLRRQALSCYGETNLQTPNIDALAHKGTRFAQSCSTFPICVAFRFSLITGQYAHSRQAPGIDWRMSPAERTLADEFNEAGYHTAYVGKWHLYGGLGPALMKRPVPREHQGRWDKWLGFEFRNSHFDTVYFEDDDPTPRPIEGYQTDGLFDVAMNHLASRSDADEPFCCVLSVEPPHPPYEAPPELEEKWLKRDITLPPNFLEVSEDVQEVTGIRPEPERERAIKLRKIYYAMIENLDWNVGRMTTFLQEQGLVDNTIVVFLADHGELGGAHGIMSKQYPFEESIGIPWLVCGPGVATNHVLNQPTSTEDISPTLCGLADITPRDTLPGDNLSPLIRGEKEQVDREGVMLEYVKEVRPNAPFHKQPWRAFRSERYKYTVLGETEGLQPWQFFDLEKDPHELHNLVNDAGCESLVKEYHQLLRNRMVATGDHAWLAAAFGIEALNEYVPCAIKG